MFVMQRHVFIQLRSLLQVALNLVSLYIIILNVYVCIHMCKQILAHVHTSLLMEHNAPTIEVLQLTVVSVAAVVFNTTRF